MDDFNIESGEAKVLLPPIDEGADLVTTDDRDDRRACKILNLKFVTAVALLIRAFEKGLIEKISRQTISLKLKGFPNPASFSAIASK